MGFIHRAVVFLVPFPFNINKIVFTSDNFVLILHKKNLIKLDTLHKLAHISLLCFTYFITCAIYNIYLLNKLKKMFN